MSLPAPNPSGETGATDSIWDINTATDLNWDDSTPTSTYYQETTLPGDAVILDEDLHHRFSEHHAQHRRHPRQLDRQQLHV